MSLECIFIRLWKPTTSKACFPVKSNSMQYTQLQIRFINYNIMKSVGVGKINVEI